jgi:type IV pilus assembly protein PilA
MIEKKKRILKNKNGFTLIEIMVVIAIIGILAALAVPKYQDYIAKTRIAEGLSLAAAAKLAITEVYSGKGATDMSEATQETFKSATTHSVKEVKIEKTGAITVVYQSSVAPEGSNILNIIPVNNAGSDVIEAVDLSSGKSQPWAGIWSCKSPATTLPQKLLPADCK